MSRSTVAPSSIAKQTRRSIMRSFRRVPRDPMPSKIEPANEPIASQSTHRGLASLSVWLGWAAVAFFMVAVLRRGWISDDAFITMRAVDHLFHGRGFVYNAGERVLGFTNPLWALLLTVPYTFIRDPYFAPIVGSVVVSALFGMLLVFRSGKDYRVGALVLIALCFSRSFVDFSTSGLENPLTHLLLALFCIEFLKGEGFSLLRFTFIASLAVVNRFDTLPLLVPALVLVYRQGIRRSDRRALWLGLLPAILWFAFAIIYYGFPFPNTAYAKLNAEIPKGEMLRQGLSYLVDALVQDPQTIIVIVAAIATLFVQRRKLASATTLLVAMALDIAYVVYIGGDFMSGRFLTPLVAFSAVVLVHFWAPYLAESVRMRSAVIALGGTIACLAFSPLRDDPIREKRDFPVTRIVNERSWFQEHLALFVNLRPVQWKGYGLYAEGKAVREKHRRVVLFNNVGMFAWGAGPDIHVVDDMALTDPLLARIPFEYREDWRTGHLPRAIPEGYLDSLESGRNVIRDPCISEYFDRLDGIVRGPLFTAERWAAIITLNLPGGMTVKACPDRIPVPEAALPPSPIPPVQTPNATPVASHPEMMHPPVGSGQQNQ